MTQPDPLAQAKALNNQVFAQFSEHLKGLISAYRQNLGKFDREDLLVRCIKSLIEDDTNDREALCIQVFLLVDKIARAQR